MRIASGSAPNEQSFVIRPKLFAELCRTCALFVCLANKIALVFFSYCYDCYFIFVYNC